MLSKNPQHIPTELVCGGGYADATRATWRGVEDVGPFKTIYCANDELGSWTVPNRYLESAVSIRLSAKLRDSKKEQST
jgi:hypothetical protein